MAEPPKPNAVPQVPPPPRTIPPVPPAARPTPPPYSAGSPPAHAKRSGGVVLPLILIVLLVLIGGFIYLAAAQPQQLFALLERAGVPAPGGGADVAALQTQVRALQQRPLPAPTDLRPLEQRLASLEQRLGVVEARPPGSGSGPDIDLRPLEQRLAALEQRATGDSAVQELAGRLQAVEQNSQTSAAQASRNARLQAAAVALDAGRPIGDIPGAPPALKRFATAAPPTLYALRQSFPAAAAAAHQASAPATEGLSFTDRMLLQAQKLLVVHDGEKVLVGAPADRVLAQARAKLDIGDLAAAVAALEGLDPEAARVMTPWRDEAQSLLDARSALAALVAS